jgi:hypothetical protein
LYGLRVVGRRKAQAVFAAADEEIVLHRFVSIQGVNRGGYAPHFRANVYVGLPPFGFHALRVNAHRFLWLGKFVAPKAFARRLSGSAPIEAVNTENQKLGMFPQSGEEDWQKSRA